MLSMDNTSTGSAEDGFDDWHQATCQNFSLSVCKRPVGQAFRARVSSREFGPLVMSEALSLQAESILMTRGRGEIRVDQRDHFMLYLILSGRVDLEQDRRRTSASAGDMFIYDQATPFSLEFHSSRVVIVNVPRPLLVSRIPKVRRFTAHRIAGSSKMGALVGSLVQHMSTFDVMTQTKVADRLSLSAMDILATALDLEVVGNENLQRERHRLLPQVKNYILAHLHETDLDLESIARAQSIAPRTLNRVFAAEGTTPIRWLWQQRLASSYKALSEKQVATVTDAALGSGFSDMSHFSRAFKREFGRLPHAILATE